MCTTYVLIYNSGPSSIIGRLAYQQNICVSNAKFDVQVLGMDFALYVASLLITWLVKESESILWWHEIILKLKNLEMQKNEEVKWKWKTLTFSKIIAMSTFGMLKALS